MKKIIPPAVFITLMLLAVSCDTESQEIEINPIPVLRLMGNSTLNVTATYNGTPVAGGKIFAYLYPSLGASTRSPKWIYRGWTDSAVTAGVPYTITINGIRDGGYYILVFYDYNAAGGNHDNRDDRYALYDKDDPAGTHCTALADKLPIANIVDVSGFIITDTYFLQGQSMYDTTGCP